MGDHLRVGIERLSQEQIRNLTARPSLNLTLRSESVIEDVIQHLKILALDELNDEWVDTIWDTQFTECPDLEISISSRTLMTALADVTKLSSEWIKLEHRELENLNRTLDRSGANESAALALNESASAITASFWKTLIEREVKYRNLIALLYYYMHQGQDVSAGTQSRNLCLRATSLYFILLAVPGSSAFNIFHPVLYAKALETFRLALKLHLGKASPRKKNRGRGAGGFSQLSQKSQKPRKRRPSKASSTSSALSQLEAMESDDSDGDTTLDDRDVQELTIGLNEVLFNLLVFLDHFSLKRSSESMEITVQELVDLTHLETQFPNLDFGQPVRRSGLSSLAFNSYIGLSKICRPLHGSVDKNLKLVLRFLLPGLLMNPTRGASDLTPKGFAVIREHSKHFVKYLITQLKEIAHDPAEVLIEHMCLRVPDRAESRLRTSEVIFDLLDGLPIQIYDRIVRWLSCLAHHDKPAHRLFAIEVMGRILAKSKGRSAGIAEAIENQDVSIVDEHDYGSTPRQSRAGSPARHVSGNLDIDRFIFGVIYSRCRDNAASVRARSLQTLAEITELPDVVGNMFIGHQRVPEFTGGTGDQEAEIAAVAYVDVDPEPRRPVIPRPLKKLVETSDFVKLLQDPTSDLSSVDPTPSTDDFIDFLRRRALDDSVYVRKNALQVLKNILKYTSGLFEMTELISILSEHCRDPSLMVRKQIVDSMTEVLKSFPDDDFVVTKWVEGVFPLILDVEAKAAERARECIWEMLMAPIRAHGREREILHHLPWRILRETESQKMTRYLSRACAAWAAEKKFTKDLMTKVESHLLHEQKDWAWLLLALVSGHVQVSDPSFAMKYFNESIHTQAGVGLYTLLQVLRVLFASVSNLPADERVLLQKDLIELVRRFIIPPELISTAVDICSVVSSLQAKVAGSTEINMKQYLSNVDGWAVEIIEMIDNELTERILQPTNDGETVETKRMHCQIFTLGELAQICPHRINNRLFLLMQSIIFQQGQKHRRKKNREPIIIPTSQTQTTQPLECAFTPTIRLQALSVVTLSKMCLQNEEMAKKILPAFGRLLSTAATADDEAIRNNIMYALSDMCRRYATVVEPLMPQITACLKDNSLVVRRTTLTTLIHLLQEDYLKMTGSLFFRILQTLSDPEEEIRHLTIFFIQQRLHKRFPKIMCNHFIEAIYHFNEYVNHQSYNKYIVSETEKRLFSLKGSEVAKRNERLKVYKFMLEHMTDEHRLGSTNRLCTDILHECVEGRISLSDPSGVDVLQDALSCLSCDEIKLAFLKTRNDETEEEAAEGQMMAGEAANEAALKTAVKKTLISQVVKRNVVENIVPIVIKLKHKLEAAKSPLLNDLMHYLREMMKDYKNEVKEILAADKALANEIQFDLKKWEEQEQERQRREQEQQGVDSQTPEKSGTEMLRAVLQTAMTKLRLKRQKRQRGEMDDADDDDEDKTDNEADQRAVAKNFFETFLLRPDDVPDTLNNDVDSDEDQDSNILSKSSQLAEKMLSPKVVMLRMEEHGGVSPVKRLKSRRTRNLEGAFSATSSPVTAGVNAASAERNFEEGISPFKLPSTTILPPMPRSHKARKSISQASSDFEDEGIKEATTDDHADEDQDKTLIEANGDKDISQPEVLEDSKDPLPDAAEISADLFSSQSLNDSPTHRNQDEKEDTKEKKKPKSVEKQTSQKRKHQDEVAGSENKRQRQGRSRSRTRGTEDAPDEKTAEEQIPERDEVSSEPEVVSTVAGKGRRSRQPSASAEATADRDKEETGQETPSEVHAADDQPKVIKRVAQKRGRKDQLQASGAGSQSSSQGDGQQEDALSQDNSLKTTGNQEDLPQAPEAVDKTKNRRGRKVHPPTSSSSQEPDTVVDAPNEPPSSSEVPASSDVVGKTSRKKGKKPSTSDEGQRSSSPAIVPETEIITSTALPISEPNDKVAGKRGRKRQPSASDQPETENETVTSPSKGSSRPSRAAASGTSSPGRGRRKRTPSRDRVEENVEHEVQVEMVEAQDDDLHPDDQVVKGPARDSRRGEKSSETNDVTTGKRGRKRQPEVSGDRGSQDEESDQPEKESSADTASSRRTSRGRKLATSVKDISAEKTAETAQAGNGSGRKRRSSTSISKNQSSTPDDVTGDKIVISGQVLNLNPPVLDDSPPKFTYKKTKLSTVFEVTETVDRTSMMTSSALEKQPEEKRRQSERVVQPEQVVSPGKRIRKPTAKAAALLVMAPTEASSSSLRRVSRRSTLETIEATDEEDVIPSSQPLPEQVRGRKLKAISPTKKSSPRKVSKSPTRGLSTVVNELPVASSEEDDVIPSSQPEPSGSRSVSRKRSHPASSLDETESSKRSRVQLIQVDLEKDQENDNPKSKTPVKTKDTPPRSKTPAKSKVSSEANQPDTDTTTRGRRKFKLASVPQPETSSTNPQPSAGVFKTPPRKTAPARSSSTKSIRSSSSSDSSPIRTPSQKQPGRSPSQRGMPPPPTAMRTPPAGTSRAVRTPARAANSTSTCPPLLPSKRDMLKNQIRAISTPSRNETILRDNVTFMEKSHELSAIPVLSPPSTRKRGSRAGGSEEPAADNSSGSSGFSFRFRPSGRKSDPFEDLVKTKPSKK